MNEHEFNGELTIQEMIEELVKELIKYGDLEKLVQPIKSKF